MLISPAYCVCEHFMLSVFCNMPRYEFVVGPIGVQLQPTIYCSSGSRSIVGRPAGGDLIRPDFLALFKHSFAHLCTSDLLSSYQFLQTQRKVRPNINLIYKEPFNLIPPHSFFLSRRCFYFIFMFKFRFIQSNINLCPLFSLCFKQKRGRKVQSITSGSEIKSGTKSIIEVTVDDEFRAGRL